MRGGDLRPPRSALRELTRRRPPCLGGPADGGAGPARVQRFRERSREARAGVVHSPGLGDGGCPI
eukprot:2346916-Pyramimonas_sp.AAC.1